MIDSQVLMPALKDASRLPNCVALEKSWTCHLKPIVTMAVDGGG